MLTEYQKDVLLRVSTAKRNIPNYGDFYGVILHAMDFMSRDVQLFGEALAELEELGLVETIEFDIATKRSIGHGYKLTYEGTKAIGEMRYNQWKDKDKLQSIYQEMYR